MVMSAVVIWTFVFLTGASLSRLATADKLTAGLRERWVTHWNYYIDRTLHRADAHLQVQPPEWTIEKRAELRGQIAARAAGEPGVRLWASRTVRRDRRPWSGYGDDIARFTRYAELLSCRWCLPFWVYLVWVVWTWGRVYGFSDQVLVAAWVPMDWWLFSFVLSARWLYALVDMYYGDH